MAPIVTKKHLSTIDAADLEKVVQYGVGIPAYLSSPPWKMPAYHPKSTIINKILDQSWRLQISRVSVRQARAFDKSLMNNFLVANLSVDVSTLLHHYLKCVGVTSTVVYGSRDVVLPYTFLDIDGVIIDNVFEGRTVTSEDVANGPEEFMRIWFERKGQYRTVEYYDRATPGFDSISRVLDYARLQYGDEGKEFLRVEQPIVWKRGQNEFNMRKGVTINLSKPYYSPGLVIYNKLMLLFLERECGVTVSSLETEMARVCWWCNAAPGTLMKCSLCKVAKYCNAECQKEDWKDMHKGEHTLMSMKMSG